MAESLIRNVWLIPLLPLLGGLIAFVGGHRLRGWNHIPVVAGIGIAFVLSFDRPARGTTGTPTTQVYTWIDIEGMTGATDQPTRPATGRSTCPSSSASTA